MSAVIRENAPAAFLNVLPVRGNEIPRLRTADSFSESGKSNWCYVIIVKLCVRANYY